MELIERFGAFNWETDGYPDALTNKESEPNAVGSDKQSELGGQSDKQSELGGQSDKNISLGMTTLIILKDGSKYEG